MTAPRFLALLVNTRLRNYAYVKEWRLWGPISRLEPRHGYWLLAGLVGGLLLFAHPFGALMIWLRAITPG